MVSERVGVSPEARAERRALAVRLEVERDPDLVLLNSRHASFRHLPFLDGRFLAESWVPKYIPETGELYITRWEDPTRTSISPDGKKVRFVPVPKGSSYDTLVKPDSVRGEVDLAKIPESWVVLKIIPQKHWDIESALRQQDEIIHDYGLGGPEVTRVMDLASEIHGLAVKYISGAVTSGNLSRLQEEVNEILEANGLLRPSDENLKEIADKLTRAASRDSLARINQGRARFILGSAHVKAAMREVSLRHSGEKAKKIYSLLLTEREIERLSLQMAKDAVDRLGCFEGKVDPDSLFVREVPQRITDTEISGFREKLGGVAVSLRMNRVNPYFLVARMADLMLTGNDFRSSSDVRAMTNLLKLAGVEGLLKVAKDGSVDRLVRQRNPFYARKMLHDISSLLGSCLNDPRLNDIKVF